jgi:hypothetical protein
MKDEFKERLLRRFVEEPELLSRNRNFHAYLDPRVRRSARVGRIVRSLRDDLQGHELEGASLLRAPEPGGHGEVILELQFRNGRRQTRLSRIELGLLLEDEGAHERLRALLDAEVVAA